MIDIHHIPAEQYNVHKRLENWAMWVRPGFSASICPMFAAMGYVSNSRQWHAPEYRPTCDRLDAQKIEKLVCSLPPANRQAIVWWYIYTSGALRIQKRLGVSLEGLDKLVRDGRTMLKNKLSATLLEIA